MKVKKFGQYFLVRIDKGEEIIASLKQACRDHGIRLGAVSGIGAANRLRIGLFDPATKKYGERELAGNFEITALTGNITTMKGEPYLHLHITVGDEHQCVFGGHLSMAVVSATCEIIIAVIDGEAERRFNEEAGLNLLDI
jgi:predicted DNA-binding protein with PD1-like motif